LVFLESLFLVLITRKPEIIRPFCIGLLLLFYAAKILFFLESDGVFLSGPDGIGLIGLSFGVEEHVIGSCFLFLGGICFGVVFLLPVLPFWSIELMISFIFLICLGNNIFLFKTSIRPFFMNSRRPDLRIGARHIMNGRIFGGVKEFLLELRQSLLVYFPFQNLVCSPKSHILIFALLVRIERFLISCPNLNSNHILARYVFPVGLFNGDKLDSELAM
jgi:hypothetical protein